MTRVFRLLEKKNKKQLKRKPRLFIQPQSIEMPPYQKEKEKEKEKEENDMELAELVYCPCLATNGSCVCEVDGF